MTFKVYFIREGKRFFKRQVANSEDEAIYMVRGSQGEITIVKTEVEVPEDFNIFELLGLKK